MEIAFDARMTTAPPPDDPAATYERLREEIIAQRAVMPKRLAQIAEFAIASPDEMALGTVGSIAARAGVQPSTLVRFAQALGFQGFSDLQAVYRRKLQQRWPDYHDRISSLRAQIQGDPRGDLLAGFSEATIRSILRLREAWDAEKFARAAGIIAAAETIYLAGNRRAFPASAYLAYLFGKLEMRHRLLTNLAHMDDFEFAGASARDALIAISFTPYTPATVESASQAARQGVSVVAITDSNFSPLVNVAEVWLEAVEEDFAGFRSLGATFSLCMALAIRAGDLRGK
jgi:DNA-binding MurR/RpiR family transcriptional regulator